VLDRYPPRPGGTSPGSTTSPVLPRTASPPPPATGSDSATAPGTTAPPTSPPSGPLIRLDRPFDVDEFANLLGETTIRVTVPRENLIEVLRRVTEFMGFGIYVYSLSVRPAASDLLKEFVVELQRVDFARDQNAWVPFVEKGTAESPFGPGSA
jgi:hypothetical protein